MHVLFLPFHIMASASFACINLLYGCFSVVCLMVQMQDIPKHNFFNIVNLSLAQELITSFLVFGRYELKIQVFWLVMHLGSFSVRWSHVIQVFICWVPSA
jgi:hypothetical protein